MGLREILEELTRLSDPVNVTGMARFGIAAERKAYGVRMPELRALAKRVGTDHVLAAELWEDGARECRILATLVDDPDAVTREQMEAWVASFDDWETCDQACMNLFWRTPYAREMARKWAIREERFVRRAAFSLVAVLAWKDKQASDASVLEMLDMIEEGAKDPRPMVRKSVDWALRQSGKRSAGVHGSALDIARRLAASEDRNQAWVGRTAAKELDSYAVRERLGLNP